VEFTAEEQRFVLDLASRIYANLMGAPDSMEKFSAYDESWVGKDIFAGAAREAFHRAEWFVQEMRLWKEKVRRLTATE
jgi:hypothetical protein